MSKNKTDAVVKKGSGARRTGTEPETIKLDFIEHLVDGADHAVKLLETRAAGQPRAKIALHDLGDGVISHVAHDPAADQVVAQGAAFPGWLPGDHRRWPVAPDRRAGPEYIPGDPHGKLSRHEPR